MKTVFQDVAPCNLVEVYSRFRGACCLHHQGGNFYQTTRRSIPEDCHLNTDLDDCTFVNRSNFGFFSACFTLHTCNQLSHMVAMV
jgi:hypothetical protein